jgi:hypothetical protein
MRAASFPFASTTSKLADAPGNSAAMPTGVMVGSDATAARTVSSFAPSIWRASSKPMSKRMASTTK